MQKSGGGVKTPQIRRLWFKSNGFVELPELEKKLQEDLVHTSLVFERKYVSKVITELVFC
jgi:hypothetical protein